MALYSTRYGLPQSMVDYLNQALPNISGIRSIPVEAPVEEDVVTEEGIASLYPQVAASGEGFYSSSPYSPDPSRVSGPIDMKTKPMNIYNYEPGSFEDDFYNRLAEKGILEYGNADYFPEQGGIQTLLSNLKENPIVQAGLMAINPLGTLLGNMAKALPVNERAIQEKALRQMGYSIDDIGRIVQGPGDYLTRENIMSGYAASQMTPETFDERIASILNRSLPQTAASAAKIKAIQEAKQDFLDAQKLTEIRKEAQLKEKKLSKQKTESGGASATPNVGGDFAGKGSGALGPAGGATQKNYGGGKSANPNVGRSAAATRSKDLGSMRGGVGR